MMILIAKWLSILSICSKVVFSFTVTYYYMTKKRKSIVIIIVIIMAVFPRALDVKIFLHKNFTVLGKLNYIVVLCYFLPKLSFGQCSCAPILLQVHFLLFFGNDEPSLGQKSPILQK